MKKISPEEFIIGLLIAKTELKVDVRKLYHFEKISRTENLYCGFNFNDLIRFSSLYPALVISNLISNGTELTLRASNERTLATLKAIYGISGDLNKIIEIWRRI